MRILALVLWSGAAFQDDAHVASRLKDLESPDVRTVYRAVERLAELGETALPSLEAHSKTAAPRVRTYLELAAQDIRSARVQPDYPRPKRHSTKSADKTAADLLMDLKNRTGLPLSLESLLEEEKLPEIPLDLREVTPLEALDAICKAGGLTLEHPGARFEIYPGGYPDFPKFFFDHYLFRLESYARTRSVTFRKPLRDRVKIEMAILWDPAIAPTRLLPARLLEVVDDAGKNLIPPPDPSPSPSAGAAAAGKPGSDAEAKPVPEPGVHPSVPEGAGAESFEILPPGPKATKIARLRGVLPVMHPRARVEMTFEKPAAGQKKEVGGFQVSIKAVDREHAAVDLVVTSKNLKLEELRAKPIVATIRLKGQETPRCVANAEASEAGLAVRIEFEHFRTLRSGGVLGFKDATAEIQTLQVAVITETVARQVPFEFRDVTIR